MTAYGAHAERARTNSSCLHAASASKGLVLMMIDSFAADILPLSFHLGFVQVEHGNTHAVQT